MTALLLKDLRLLRPFWWLIVPGHMLFAANGIIHPEAFFWTNVALACAYTLILILIEWTQDAERFVGSLPVDRAAVVEARYLGALGAALGGTVLYAVYGRVLLGLGGERVHRRWAEARGWESPEGLLAFFLFVWLLSVGFLPFYFRSGLAKGTWLFLGSALSVAVPTTLGVHWLSGSGGGAAVYLPGEALRRGLTNASAAMGPTFTVSAALAAAALLGLASFQLAIRFYERRDL